MQTKCVTDIVIIFTDSCQSYKDFVERNLLVLCVYSKLYKSIKDKENV